MVLLEEEAEGASLWNLREMLRQRFGDTQQSSRYRSELRARRRRKGESLQALYTDISRLVTLAHPGPQTELSKRLAVEAFVDSLNDSYLEERVADAEPGTLAQAYRKALKCDANRRDRHFGGGRDERSEHKRDRHVRLAVRSEGSESDNSDEPRSVRAVTKTKSTPLAKPQATATTAASRSDSGSASSTGEWKAVLLAVEASNKAMEQMREMVSGLSANVQRVESLVNDGGAKGGGNGGGSKTSKSASGSGKDLVCHRCNKRGHVANRCRAPAPADDRKGNTGDRECYQCHQKGHLRRDCPQRTQSLSDTGAGAVSTASASS